MEQFPTIVATIMKHHHATNPLLLSNATLERTPQRFLLCVIVSFVGVACSALRLRLWGDNHSMVWQDALLAFMLVAIFAMFLLGIAFVPLFIAEIRLSTKQDFNRLAARSSREGLLIALLAAQHNAQSLEFAKRRFDHEIAHSERGLSYIVGKFLPYTVLGFISLLIFTSVQFFQIGKSTDNLVLIFLSAALGVFLAVLTERNKMNNLFHYAFVVEEARKLACSSPKPPII